MHSAILQPWIVIENTQFPEERITIGSGTEKYAVVFSDLAIAKAFLHDLSDPDLRLESLETWVLKDTYLLTLGMIGVTRVVFDYQKGKHDVLSAPLLGIQAHVQNQLTAEARGWV